MQLITAIGVTFTLFATMNYLLPQIVNTYYSLRAGLIEGERELAQARWMSQQAKARREREEADEAGA